jgi:glycolate oxidase FAD binding subunit
MPNTDLTAELQETVRAAAAARTPLAIRGSGTKRFLTGEPAGTPLDVTGHRGIIAYEPTELVITACAGTPLAEIDAALVARGQMLGFEPPRFGDTATLGGTIACGLSGPRRPYAGSARDFVLGARILNGRGEALKFGGQVMKNVAGFDISRLLVGSRGTLGVLLDISLKVLPKPPVELSLVFQMPADRAIAAMSAWAGQPLPLSAACHLGESLYVRLSGNDKGVQAARARLGGELLADDTAFWQQIREHRHDFFRDAAPLWRLSLPPAAAPLSLAGEWLIDWGGAQRWLKTAVDASEIHRQTAAAGGHAGLFRAAPASAGRHPELPAAIRQLQEQLKQSFDPAGIFNPA